MRNPEKPVSDAQKENEGSQQSDLPDVVTELVPYLDNDYVKEIRGNRIFYRPDFYVAMYKRIHDENMSYVEAYESLGFDCKVLGKTRAEQAGKNTMEKARQNKLFPTDPESYDGSVPLKELPHLSTEEMLAYTTKRIIYLEAMVEAQKKIPFVLAESCIR